MKHYKEIILDLLSSEDREFSVDEIASEIYGENVRPVTWRNVITDAMRFLIMNPPSYDLKVQRTSDIGAGKIGKYKIIRE